MFSVWGPGFKAYDGFGMFCSFEWFGLVRVEGLRGESAGFTGIWLNYRSLGIGGVGSMGSGIKLKIVVAYCMV